MQKMEIQMWWVWMNAIQNGHMTTYLQLHGQPTCCISDLIPKSVEELQ